MNAEQMILLSQKLVMLSVAKNNEERKRLTQEIAALNAELTGGAESNGKTVYCRPLKFTDKEISKMPKRFRKEFRVEGCTAHVRRRCDDRYRCSYEIRYRRNGYNVTASATTLEEAKQRFIEKLRKADEQKKRGVPKPSGNSVPTTFNGFAEFWLDNFHKRKVVPKNYENAKRLFRSKLAGRFADRQIADVNAKDLQDVIDEFIALGRTAEDLHGLLNQIFSYAVKFGLIAHNPVELTFRKPHKRKHGKALTLEEEELLLSASAGTKYQTMFAVALCTGMRPNEYKSATIKGDMIVAINSKRRYGEIEYKRIPIIKKLRPYLNGLDTITWVKYEKIRARFKEILPNHNLYDLRVTFYTHCEMCGVAEAAKNEMVGHSNGKLADTYLDLSDEYLIKEAEKLDW